MPPLTPDDWRALAARVFAASCGRDITDQSDMQIVLCIVGDIEAHGGGFDYAHGAAAEVLRAGGLMPERR